MSNTYPPHEIWEKRLSNLDKVYKFKQTMSPGTSSYLHARLPFIQIINIDIDYNKITDGSFSQFKNWIIVDNGEAMSCSLGKNLFLHSFLESDEDDDDDGGSGKRKPPYERYGTISGQTITMANELIRIIREGKSWGGIYFSSGTELMKKAALLAAQANSITTKGFESTKDGEEKYRTTLTEQKKTK